MGHHANGFLNPAEDHPLEFAVDANLWKSKPSGFAVHTASAAMFNFFAATTQAYAVAVNNSALAISVAVATSAWSSFNDLMVAETVAILPYFWFQKDLLKDDFCRATTVPEALANLARAQDWSRQAVQMALTNVSPGQVARAVSLAIQFIDSQFAAHNGSSCL